MPTSRQSQVFTDYLGFDFYEANQGVWENVKHRREISNFLNEETVFYAVFIGIAGSSLETAEIELDRLERAAQTEQEQERVMKLREYFVEWKIYPSNVLIDPVIGIYLAFIDRTMLRYTPDPDLYRSILRDVLFILESMLLYFIPLKISISKNHESIKKQETTVVLESVIQLVGNVAEAIEQRILNLAPKADGELQITEPSPRELKKVDIARVIKAFQDEAQTFDPKLFAASFGFEYDDSMKRMTNKIQQKNPRLVGITERIAAYLSVEEKIQLATKLRA